MGLRRGPDTLDLETMHVADLPEVRDAHATAQAARERLDNAAARVREIYDTLETPIPKPDVPTPTVSRLDRLRARLAKADAEAKRDLAEADLEQALADLAAVTEAARQRIRAARRPAEDRLRLDQFRAADALSEATAALVAHLRESQALGVASATESPVFAAEYVAEPPLRESRLDAMRADLLARGIVGV